MNESSELHSSSEICRVCRSEGTPDQPLFYPCLCSGSIKYIHQDCLIEWLKHSRKKYCELCKHPFTFSPVYADQMPQSIPVAVLLLGMVKKIFNGLRIGFSLSFSIILWFIVVPLLTTQIFRYYFGWNWNEILLSAFAIQELNDFFLETSLTVGFDVIQGFFMTGFTVFLILAMLLVREFLIMIGFDPVNSHPEVINATTNSNIETRLDGTSSTSTTTNNSNIPSIDVNSETSPVADAPLSTTSSITALPNVNSLRSPLSPSSQLVSPLSPTRRHSEFRNSLNPNPISPGSPGGNYWVEQAHPKEFRNYMKRRDLQRALMESEQTQRPFDVESYINENETDPLIQPEDHVSNVSGTSTVRSRFTATSNYSNNTTSSPRESFRCRICSSNTCTSRDHVIQASHMRHTLTAQRNQAILQRTAREQESQADALNNNTPTTNTTNSTNTTNTTNNNNPRPTATAANTDFAGWNFDAAESISFPEFFGFTLEGTPILQLLQNSAIVIGCNALFMHIFLFVPFIMGKTISNESLANVLYGMLEQSEIFKWTEFTWKYISLFNVERESFAEFGRNVIIGYFLLCSIGALYVNCTRHLKDSFHKTLVPILGFILVFIKLLTLLFVEMIMFPLACGFMIDYFCLDLFPGSQFFSRLESIKSLPISSLTIHWALGAFFMLNFASFVTFSRSFLRPGLLFFLRNPQDPDSNPIKEMVERSFLDQIYRLFISLIFYGTLIYSSVGICVKIATIPAIYQHVFPLNFKFHEPLIEIPIDLLFHLLLRSLLVNFSPVKLFKSLYISIQKHIYRKLKLSSYFIGGGRYLSEESFPKGGTWVAVPDFDRIYSRQRMKEIRSRVVSPVDIAKLKVLYDKQENPVIDNENSRTTNTTSTKSDWTVVFRPNYFKLKCFLVLISILLCLQAFLLSISIGPLLFGRLIVKLFQNYAGSNVNTDGIHEIYSWHIGSFGLFGIVKIIEVLVFHNNTQNRNNAHNTHNIRNQQSSSPNLIEKIKFLFQSIFKISILGIFLIIIWPLQVGIIFTSFLNPILLTEEHFWIPFSQSHNFDLNDTVQLSILFFGTCWTIGFPVLRIIHHFPSQLPLPESTISYLRNHSRSIDQFDPIKFLKIVAIPVTILFSITIFMPPMTFLILLSLPFPSPFPFPVSLLLKYQNCSHFLFLSAYFTTKILKFILKTLKNIISGIRDENYLIGRRLHNLENRAI